MPGDGNSTLRSPDNAIEYDQSGSLVLPEVSFDLDLPADPELGAFAETMRALPQSSRSIHPLLSFAGVHSGDALAAQTLDDPWAPVRWLADNDGDVLLVGVDHRANISLHYAEQLAGRRTFTRWALQRDRVVECLHMPGCSRGFQSIAARLEGVSRGTMLGTIPVAMIPIRDLINVAKGWLREDPLALLCNKDDCRSCHALRKATG
jgi:aminoglycoside 3-N-acetyltransferase